MVKLLQWLRTRASLQYDLPESSPYYTVKKVRKRLAAIAFQGKN